MGKNIAKAEPLTKVIGLFTCHICGRDFPLIDVENYVARDANSTTGLAAAISGKEPTIYDAMDCPFCGCQNIIQERKRYYDPVQDILNDFDDDDEEDDECDGCEEPDE